MNRRKFLKSVAAGTGVAAVGGVAALAPPREPLARSASGLAMLMEGQRNLDGPWESASDRMNRYAMREMLRHSRLTSILDGLS